MKSAGRSQYGPGYFVRQEHVQEKKLACRCGQYIATAEPPPPRVLDKSQYGAGSSRAYS